MGDNGSYLGIVDLVRGDVVNSGVRNLTSIPHDVCPFGNQELCDAFKDQDMDADERCRTLAYQNCEFYVVYSADPDRAVVDYIINNKTGR